MLLQIEARREKKASQSCNMGMKLSRLWLFALLNRQGKIISSPLLCRGKLCVPYTLSNQHTTLATATRLRGKTHKRHCGEMLLDNKNNKKNNISFIEPRTPNTQPTHPSAMGMGWMQKEEEENRKRRLLLFDWPLLPLCILLYFHYSSAALMPHSS